MPGRQTSCSAEHQENSHILAGYCAISGKRIHRGDIVYRPTGRPPPGNRAAMITMEAVARAS
ncbi:DUF3331 domain-containing protein [Paraburkholderia susongensis]|uniref:DUF3331 domain-containing protein n=1 Tax=Paraburkholderia susongensis TaxID=1515439 RepID=UPI000A1CAD65|nr:DUF3331 domain-containing protein [Paraburkholderia susongensis]